MTVEFRVPSHATEDGTAGNSTGFGEFVRHRAASGELVVQPRMGFSDPARMRAGLLATRRAAATTVGTLTVDSYTRVGDLAAARDALRAGIALNGYPSRRTHGRPPRRSSRASRPTTSPYRSGTARPTPATSSPP